MIVAIFAPPSRIDGTNVAAFAETVDERVARDGCVVIDCSEVVWIAMAAMRVLEIASRDAPVTLVNPSPAVHLMAATFAENVRCRDDGLSLRPVVSDVARRGLTSIHPCGKVAS